MTRDEILKEIRRLESLTTTTNFPNLLKIKLEHLNYLYYHPYRFKIKRLISRFLLWLENQLWKY